MGTDQHGRDVMARVIHGARVSLLVGVVAVMLYVAIGVILGALAGYFGGGVDLCLSRLMEVVICVPDFFFLLALFCFLSPGIYWIVLVLGFLRWPGVARLVRGEFLRLRGEEFVIAGRALGLSPFRLMVRHLLPNGLGPVIVAATFGVAGAILLESGLSFLGFGVQPPSPSWGQMLAKGKYWWLTLFPGGAIFVTVTSFNLIGEGLRAAFDPRGAGRPLPEGRIAEGERP